MIIWFLFTRFDYMDEEIMMFELKREYCNVLFNILNIF